MAISGCAKMAIMVKISKNDHNGYYGLTRYGHEYILSIRGFGSSGKCRSVVKTVFKKMHRVKSYDQNNLRSPRKVIFFVF